MGRQGGCLLKGWVRGIIESKFVTLAADVSGRLQVNQSFIVAGGRWLSKHQSGAWLGSKVFSQSCKQVL